MSPIASGALAWALARLGEATTWAGFAALIGSMNFLPEHATLSQIVGGLGVAVCGIVAIVKKERGST